MSPATRVMIAELTRLAEQGLTARQASEAIGSTYHYVIRFAKAGGIAFTRQKWSGAETKDSQRVQRVGALYKSGHTLQQIGDEFEITRERVRQLLTKHFGYRRGDGGQHISAERKRQRFEEKRNQRCLARWGCGWDDYTQLRALKKPTRAFARQRQSAGQRGIEWSLTLWQWWKFWEQSGHWPERGRGRGYVMCRLNDCGPYSIDNVYIATGVENIQDYWVDVNSGTRPRTFKKPTTGPSKEALKAAAIRYRKTPKCKLRIQLRRQGLPKAERDAIVAAQFGVAA